MKEALASPSVKCKLPETLRKRHETMKANGSYRRCSSRAENAFYEELCCLFGSDDVERAVHVNRWLIDFYVCSIDTYIQFDGVYWHGLDRPVDEIAASSSLRDAAILRTFERDGRREKWFLESGKKLVRVTDKQFIEIGRASMALLGVKSSG